MGRNRCPVGLDRVCGVEGGRSVGSHSVRSVAGSYTANVASAVAVRHRPAMRSSFGVCPMAGSPVAHEGWALVRAKGTPLVRRVVCQRSAVIMSSASLVLEAGFWPVKRLPSMTLCCW